MVLDTLSDRGTKKEYNSSLAFKDKLYINMSIMQVIFARKWIGGIPFVGVL
jgi:hypothetical protein